MMTELSLHILDIAENSTKAGASLVQITVDVNLLVDRITITIADDGCGMSEEQLASVTDPFFTTRTTRKVGLGVPFFKQAAECTDGSFSITSAVGTGTTVTASFGYSHIDRIPLGDLNSTIYTLITMHPNCDFLYTYRVGEASFVLDTRIFRELLDGIPFDTPDVSAYIKAYLSENEEEVNNGKPIF